MVDSTHILAQVSKAPEKVSIGQIAKDIGLGSLATSKVLARQCDLPGPFLEIA
jgi:hypothetical protein